ncbi:MAG: hypothetical protein PHC33_06785 [Candidatus Omnitrophica bacterium]|nr:hypothetical protein [Candidatus Omnitrophota bacterium]
MSENEAFVYLIRVARKDKMFREQLLAVLARPAASRMSVLNSMIQKMKEAGVDEKVIRAVSCLMNDSVAARVIEVLTPDDPEA